MAYMFFPILLNGLYSIFYEKGKHHYLLTVGAVGILLSHNITSVLAIIVCCIYTISNIEKLVVKEYRTTIWKNISINVVFIILLVLFFYVPFIENITNTQYVVMQEKSMSTTETVKNNAIYIYQLIFGKFQNGKSYALDYGIENEMFLGIGLPIIIPILFTPLVFNKIQQTRKELYLVTLIFGLLFAWIATTNFPWDKMPNEFSIIQFPWRMLLIATILLSIIAGINISKCFDEIKEGTILVVTLVISMYVGQYISNVIQFDNNFDETYLEQITDIENLYGDDKYCSSFEYLPVKARTEYTKNREEGVIVLSGNAIIKEEEKQKNDMTFKIEKNTDGSKLELPYIFYLGYHIELNEKEIPYEESEHGFISIEVPKEETGMVSLSYQGTTLSKVSYAISGTTFIAFIGYVIYEKRRKK